MSATVRPRGSALLYLIAPLAFLIVYYTYLAPWWMATSGVCSFSRRSEGVVEYVVQTLLSSDCSWSSPQARWALPALFIAGLFLTGLTVALWRQWDGGPPDWAVALAALGIGAYVGAAVGWGLWLLGVEVTDSLWGIDPSDTTDTADLTVLKAIGAFLAWAILPGVGGVAALVVTCKGVARGFGSSSVGAGTLAVVGVTLAASVGVFVGVSLILLAFMAALIYFGFVVMAGIMAAVVVGTLVKAVQR